MSPSRCLQVFSAALWEGIPGASISAEPDGDHLHLDIAIRSFGRLLGCQYTFSLDSLRQSRVADLSVRVRARAIVDDILKAMVAAWYGGALTSGPDGPTKG